MDNVLALKIWRSMDDESQMDLWRENTMSNHFSKTWSFNMFATSTAVIANALTRGEFSEDE